MIKKNLDERMRYELCGLVDTFFLWRRWDQTKDYDDDLLLCWFTLLAILYRIVYKNDRLMHVIFLSNVWEHSRKKYSFFRSFLRQYILNLNEQIKATHTWSSISNNLLVLVVAFGYFDCERWLDVLYMYIYKLSKGGGELIELVIKLGRRWSESGEREHVLVMRAAMIIHHCYHEKMYELGLMNFGWVRFRGKMICRLWKGWVRRWSMWWDWSWPTATSWNNV